MLILLFLSINACGGGGGGGGLNREATPRGPTPYPFIYKLWQNRYTFHIPSIDKCYPSHIPNIELCIS